VMIPRIGALAKTNQASVELEWITQTLTANYGLPGSELQTGRSYRPVLPVLVSHSGRKFPKNRVLSESLQNDSSTFLKSGPLAGEVSLGNVVETCHNAPRQSGPAVAARVMTYGKEEPCLQLLLDLRFS
jgi:hypothetical protein